MVNLKSLASLLISTALGLWLSGCASGKLADAAGKECSAGDFVQASEAKVSPWIKTLVTDFSKTDIKDSRDWSISTWGNANRTHSTDNLWREGDTLVLKVTGGTPPGQTTTGAEMVSSSRDFLYGSYRVVMKTPVEPGTVSGFFYYLSDESEIDIEFLSIDNWRNSVNLTVHKKLGPLSHQEVKLGFDPTKDFHEYRFDWYPDRVRFYVDGKLLVEMTPDIATIPSRPGHIMLNHWTLSDPGWGAGPPVKDALLYIKRIELHYGKLRHCV
jgi:beta-glucanase (GH16 family)